MYRLMFLLFLAVPAAPAGAQQAKEIRTQKSRPIAIVNLQSIRPDCGNGLIGVPVIREMPKNGTITMALNVLDQAATASCPARKVPTIMLVYSPLANFVGSDTVIIDLPEGNKITSLSYHLTVGEDDKL